MFFPCHTRFFFLLEDHKVDLLPCVGKTVVHYATREKKFILRVWSLRPEQSECNNHTRKINVFPALHTIFLLGVKKWIFLLEIIKWILLPCMGQTIVHYATRDKKFILRMWSLMPEQSECNNNKSKINVFPVSHTIFFY